MCHAGRKDSFSFWHGNVASFCFYSLSNVPGPPGCIPRYLGIIKFFQRRGWICPSTRFLNANDKFFFSCFALVRYSLLPSVRTVPSLRSKRKYLYFFALSKHANRKSDFLMRSDSPTSPVKPWRDALNTGRHQHKGCVRCLVNTRCYIV